MSIHFPKDAEPSPESSSEDALDTHSLAKESLEVGHFARKVESFKNFVDGYEEIPPREVNLCMDAADRLIAELEEKSKKLLKRAEENK